MDDAAQGAKGKPATAARMYDYYLGGIHNFPADQEAARKIIAQYPFVLAAARSNRAFLGRAVRHLAAAGIRQFLDIGSGIPTERNVHEIAEEVTPDARVVYVDIDPTAVAESLEILEGNDRAIAIRADLRRPRLILDHPAVRRLLDFGQPIGLIMAAVLHFVPDDTQAYGAVTQLFDALAPGSFLVISHTSTEVFWPDHEKEDDLYRRHTATPGTVRTRAEIEQFFTGVDLLDPGVVWAYEWQPDPDEPEELTDNLRRGGFWAGVGRKR
jgi:hypothetical protein